MSNDKTKIRKISDTLNYQSGHHNTTYTETITLNTEEKTISNSLSLLASKTSSFDGYTLEEFKKIAEDEGVSNNMNWSSLIKRLEEAHLPDIIARYYLETSRNTNWGVLYIELKASFIDRDTISLLNILSEERADEITFEMPEVIRAWWD